MKDKIIEIFARHLSRYYATDGLRDGSCIREEDFDEVITELAQLMANKCAEVSENEDY